MRSLVGAGCYAVCFLTPVCVAHTANHPYADVGWRKLRELNSTLHEKIVNMAIRYGYDDTELLAEKKLIDSGRGGEWGRTSAVSIVRPLLLFVSVRALPHTSSRFSPPPAPLPRRRTPRSATTTFRTSSSKRRRTMRRGSKEKLL